MIDQVCKRAINEISSSATSSSPKGLLQELISTLDEENVVDLFFSSKMIHEQLVRRSDGLLKFLLKKQVMTDEQIDLVWNNCQKHESLALDLITVLQNISYSMEAKELTFFVIKIYNKSPA